MVPLPFSPSPVFRPGFPARRRTRPPRPRWIAALLTGLLALPVPLVADTGEQAVTLATEAFRTGKAAALRKLLPSSGKIFVSLPSVSTTRGYLDADPLLYLLDGVFREHPTVACETLAVEDEEARLRARVRWEYRDGDGDRRVIEIRFLFSREDGTWFLREIRESYRA